MILQGFLAGFIGYFAGILFKHFFNRLISKLFRE